MTSLFKICFDGVEDNNKHNDSSWFNWDDVDHIIETYVDKNIKNYSQEEIDFTKALLTLILTGVNKNHVIDLYNLHYYDQTFKNNQGSVIYNG